MGKIVGKIFIMVGILFTIVLNARISMEIRTDNGVRDQVVVGQPFTLEVVVDNIQGSAKKPVIKGLEKFDISSPGIQMTNVNGKSTIRYSCDVRINAIGSYTIGPAVVDYQNNQLVSNEVTINVVKDIKSVQAYDNHVRNNEIKTFLRLMVDTDSVVVGQKIECTLRLYYQDNSLALNKIGVPDLPGFDVTDMGNLENGVADHNGARYYYAQWHWNIYPKASGEFIIPAYNVDYEIPVHEKNLFAGFFMFMNNRVDCKRVYSNAVSIKVVPLPAYHTPVDGIGVFERFGAQIKPSMAKEGEGMVLTLELEGNGNLDAIATPKLVLPDALKYYDSHVAIIMPRNSDELPKKQFEFIVQGMRHGEWEIPEQIFTYFDIEKNDYVQLRTSSLIVSIMPGMNNKQENLTDIDQETNSSLASSHDIIGRINSVGKWYPEHTHQPLQWWLFFLLLLGPSICGGYSIVMRQFQRINNKFLWLRKRRAFKEARKQIKQAHKLTDDTTLCVIFVDLFVACGYECSLKDSIDVLRTRGFSAEVVGEWDNFIIAITHAAYAKIGKNYDNTQLFEAAKQWIDRLEKIL